MSSRSGVGVWRSAPQPEAVTMFAKCMQLGPPWIMYDPMTEALRGLHIEIAAALDLSCHISDRSLRVSADRAPKNPDCAAVWIFYGLFFLLGGKPKAVGG
eukprot:2244148-Pyramimonas_sp.AAC.1